MDIMEYKGYYAQIMKAPRLTGDTVHMLPPGSPIDIYPVDLFKEPLPHWIKGQGNYVIPVQPDWGLWFDWTKNDSLNTSVLPTVKGMNPVTGQKTEGYGLERYENKCPIHDVEFKEGRFCEECNYKWPPQNYIAAPNRLWWDGFRTSDGKVRQFFFTEDLAKSIPENVIGKHNTVPAFGFAFYKTKQTRGTPLRDSRGWKVGEMSGTSIVNINGFHYNNSTSKGGIPPGSFTTCTSNSLMDAYNYNKMFKISDVSEPDVEEGTSTYMVCPQGIDPCAQSSSLTSGTNVAIGQLAQALSSIQQYQNGAQSYTNGAPQSIRASASLASGALANAEVGIGAGAQINQELIVDSLKLEDWQEEPTAVMRLYFIFMDQFSYLKEKGFNDLTGNKEGFLSNMPVG